MVERLQADEREDAAQAGANETVSSARWRIATRIFVDEDNRCCIRVKHRYENVALTKSRRVYPGNTDQQQLLTEKQVP
jgi:hypothetical protein